MPSLPSTCTCPKTGVENRRACWDGEEEKENAVVVPVYLPATITIPTGGSQTGGLYLLPQAPRGGSLYLSVVLLITYAYLPVVDRREGKVTVSTSTAQSWKSGSGRMRRWIMDITGLTTFPFYTTTALTDPHYLRQTFGTYLHTT